MRQIHEGLWNDCNPSGGSDVASEDEYDSYIGGVYRLHASRCTRESLVTHLLRIEIETMGLWGQCRLTPSHNTKADHELWLQR